MANLNKSFHIGRLTADPVVGHTVKERAVTTFSLAIERRIDKERSATTYLDFKAFDATATAIGKYCKKGREIYVESHAEQQVWQDKQTGKTRSKTYFMVDSFQFLDSKPRQSRAPQQQEEEEPQQQQTYTPDDADEDIPF